MRCPFCGSVRLAVLQTRDSPKNRVRRNRICRVCKLRFTTYELYVDDLKNLSQR